MKKRVAFLCPYPFGTAPGQRFRYELFLKNVGTEAFEWQVFPFLDEQTNRILYQRGQFLQKMWGVAKGFARRLFFLLVAPRYDFIFIYREITPLGPPIFEWILAKIFRKKLIYDFDDAIWLPSSTSENRIVSKLKNPSKVKKICTWAYRMSCGNEFLSDYARAVNPDVVTLVTVVDTVNMHNQIKQHQFRATTAIGWTGTHSTLHYLDVMVPVFQQLQQIQSFEFIVIADKNPHLPLDNFRFIPWQAKTEIEDLLLFDIGIMPLKNTPWELGKCGFKAIQYMALGIPTVASPVGVNNQLIKNGENGFLCSDPSEWVQRLSQLISNVELRKEIGISARKTIVENYSEIANRQKFIDLFT